ncbi:MAG: TonB-dependent receptor [Bacteroidales bacterium]
MEKNIRLATTFLLVLCLTGSAQVLSAQHRVYGKVTDSRTGEALVAATVYDTLLRHGTASNEYGYYSLTSRSTRVILRCSYVGYQSLLLPLDLSRDTLIHLTLEPSLSLGEVTVRARSKEEEFLSSQMSAHRIHASDIKNMPLLFGEADLIKALHFLPGVAAGTEGTSGMHVRGGSGDQNLILLDGMPVYNVTHLFGIFSVFNSDAINNAMLYKGGFPARYNGRLSSVLDIRLKEGNMQEFHGTASVGILATKFMLEGPIRKDRTSFLISARRTYADALSFPIQYLINQKNPRLPDTYVGYYFHDLNLKINHKLAEKDHLYLSAYAGKDEFYRKDVTPANGAIEKSVLRNGFNWGNWTSALRWNHLWTPSLFSNLTLSRSSYQHTQYDQGTSSVWSGDQVSDYDWEDNYHNRIKDLSSRFDLQWSPGGKQTVRTGITASLFGFDPGTSSETMPSPMGGTYTNVTGADAVKAWQISGYLEDEFTLGSRFQANVGLNLSRFAVQDTAYILPEPRFSARFLLSDRWVVKGSFSRMSQPVHLLTSASVGLPTDSWVPATASLAPATSWQTALGISIQPSSGLRFSLEGYYKDMDHVIEYAEGAEMQLNDKNWEDRILVGKGTSYGVELYAEMQTGRITGTLAYTLSKTTRKFEELNFGMPFPFKYDRRHDVSVTAKMKVTERLSLSAIWVLASGIHVTTEEQSYYNPLLLGDSDNDPFSGRPLGQSDMIRTFKTRNNYQLPAYHRLDLGVNLEKEKKRFHRTLSVGVYNAYARKNPFYIYSTEVYGVEGRVVKQFTMLPFLPYINYKIQF